MESSYERNRSGDEHQGIWVTEDMLEGIAHNTFILDPADIKYFLP